MRNVSDPFKQLSPIAFKNLIHTKEITVLPSSVLWHILSHENLSGTDMTLWLGIYDQVKFAEDLSGYFTIKYLASELNKSPSTIRRGIRKLREENLLDYEIAKDAKGNDIGITLQCTLPYQLGQEMLQKEKNRKKYSTAQKAERLLAMLKQDKDNRGKERPDQVTTSPTPSSRKPNPSKESATSESPSNAVSRSTKLLLDKLSLSKKLSKRRRDAVSERDDAAFRDQLDQLPDVPIESARTSPGAHGNAPPLHHFDDLVLFYLTERGVDEHLAIKRVPEIVFALSSGSLKKYEQMHGLNIACKLVKQNKWKTPYGFNSAPLH